MKKMYILFCFVLLGCFMFVFFHKTFLNQEMVFNGVMLNEKFRPNAYEFLHSEKDLSNFINRNDNTKLIGSNLKTVNFDFNNCSYCIVYGCKVKGMYYSYKTTFFDDTSPSYARPKDKKFIAIEYEKNKTNGVFIYSLKKDKALRGFYGE